VSLGRGKPTRRPIQTHRPGDLKAAGGSYHRRMAASILAESVTVRFSFDRQRRVMTPALARVRRRGFETYGLRNVSFRIGAGESVALLGPSGSGKTTLLRAISGVLEPDEGRLDVQGRLATLLATGAGLTSALTGRENALLLGVLGGLSRAESAAALEGTKVRSRLDTAFELPVSSFSQGMRARLAFAVADETHPEILILDEVHQALDQEFRVELERRADELVSRGGIVLAAGHDHAMLARLCTRALLLHEGRIVADGDFSDLVERE
jgi:ABC-type polysaccharide/polyol phosphate transport system ATPase subunit